MTGTPPSAAQVVEAYAGLRGRIVDLLRSSDGHQHEVPVPHCPDWTVRQLAAHVLGVVEDILAGRLEGVTTPAWTQAQVDRHADDPVEELVRRYAATGEAFDALLAVIPEPVNAQIVMDAVTHEHDLRHALGRPGARDSAAVHVAVRWLVDRADRLVGSDHLRPLLAGLEPFDALRSLTGRRTPARLVALGISAADVDALFATGPLVPPADDLAE